MTQTLPDLSFGQLALENAEVVSRIHETLATDKVQSKAGTSNSLKVSESKIIVLVHRCWSMQKQRQILYLTNNLSS